MIAILLIAALIVYGSLYPWSFRPNPNASVERLIRSIPWPLSPRLAVDAIANVLLYIPLGLAVFLRARQSLGRVPGAFMAVAGCLVLSLSIEYAQFFQPRRIPSGTDILTNTLGGLLGVLAAGLWPGLAAKVRAPSSAASILGPIWVLSLLFPLIPSIGLWTVRRKLQNALVFDLTTFIGATLQWLVAGILVTKQRPMWVGATLLLIPAQLLVLGRQPTADLLGGALLGSVLAVSLLRPIAAGAAALVLLALWGLSPFRTTSEHPFTWIPFIDAMENSFGAVVPLLLLKSFVYGGTALLLRRAGPSLPVATCIVTALVCVTEICQMWIAGRTPSSTDPIITVLIVWMFHVLRVRIQPSA